MGSEPTEKEAREFLVSAGVVPFEHLILPLARLLRSHALKGKKILDPCPSCGWRGLFVGEGGHLTCSQYDCKQPGVTVAVDALRKRVEELEAAQAG